MSQKNVLADNSDCEAEPNLALYERSIESRGEERREA